MTVTRQARNVVENPAGRGRVFRGDRFVAEVDYVLVVTQDLPSSEKPTGQLVTGTLRRTDKERILWGTELLTLHLQDKRKLDFVCVNFDPDCEIASTAKFYR
jgi:hypothetical protein